MFPGRIKTVTAAVALAAVVTLFAALFYSFAGHSSSPTTTTTTVPNPTTANTTLPSPTATTTMPPSPTATTTAGAVKVVQRSAQSDQVPVGNSGTVTATCEPGEQLLSGGYYVYAFESAANVVASYPSSPDAWTVTDDNTRGPSYVVITAYANCLQAPYSVGVRMVSSDSQSAGDTLADCPSGAVVTGGGFQGGIASSMPTSNGWKSAFLGAGKAFALCATARLRGAPDASATFTTQSVYGPPQGGNAHCKAGQIVTGGGYSFAQGETSIAVDTLAPDGASWGIGAAGGSTPVSVVVWATCVVAP